MPLRHISIDWAWLRENLNAIIDEINANKPLSSSSIGANSSPSGTLLTVVGAQQANTPQPSQSSTPPAPWPPTLTNTFNLQGIRVTTITLVDPTTCAQSTMNVLEYTGNPGDVIPVNVSTFKWWVTPNP